MKPFTIQSLAWQRNGISGESFYALICNRIDTDCPDGSFLITFDVETDVDGCETKVDFRSCRVVDLTAPMEKWRGDVVADYLTQELWKIAEARGVESVYDLQTAGEVVAADSEDIEG